MDRQHLRQHPSNEYETDDVPNELNDSISVEARTIKITIKFRIDLDDNSRIPHDAVKDRGVFRLFVEVIANSYDLHFKVLSPITILDIVIVSQSVFWLQTFQYSQRVLHVIVEVFTDKVVESFDAVIEDSHIVNGSKNKIRIKT